LSNGLARNTQAFGCKQQLLEIVLLSRLLKVRAFARHFIPNFRTDTKFIRAFLVLSAWRQEQTFHPPDRSGLLGVKSAKIPVGPQKPKEAVESPNED
jgi:hypothetical protein